MMETPVLLLIPHHYPSCILGLLCPRPGAGHHREGDHCAVQLVFVEMCGLWCSFPCICPPQSVQWIYMFTCFKKWKAELRLCRSCTASRWQHRFSPGSPPALPFPAAALCPLPSSRDALTLTLTQFLRVWGSEDNSQGLLSHYSPSVLSSSNPSFAFLPLF